MDLSPHFSSSSRSLKSVLLLGLIPQFLGRVLRLGSSLRFFVSVPGFGSSSRILVSVLLIGSSPRFLGSVLQLVPSSVPRFGSSPFLASVLRFGASLSMGHRFGAS